MGTLLSSKQKEVIRKIIYAVETGGQIYGKQNYSALIGAGANTANEVAITIGAGQWYATQAKTLLELIRSKDKNTFNKLDTEGIGRDLDTKNWATYSISKTSAKAKCIVSIISSPIGIKCQDELMESQITAHAASIQETYGIMSADAIAECINVKHQGGNGALKRILAKANKPYSAKSIKAALDLDIADKSSNNQVGDYKTRQDKVYNMIVENLIPTIASTNTSGNKITNNGGKTNMTEAQLRSKIANWPVQFIGITEGSSKHLKIISIFNNSGLCTRYKMTKKDSWCATTVSAAFIANNMAGEPGSGKLFESVECSCGNMIALAKEQGIWVENDNYVPKVGDVVMYDWDDDGRGNDTGWPEHVGIVIDVAKDGDSFKVIEGNIKDTVGYRTMDVNGKFIRGFITPKYNKFATTKVNESTTPEKKPTTSKVESTTVKKPATVKLNKTRKFKGKVTTKELNVRDWAGTSNTKVITKLKKGTEVGVCDTIKDKDGDDWYYIKYDAKYGFVSADYIAKTITTKKPTSLNKTRKFRGKVTASSLRVRSWAGTEHDVLRSLVKGTKVDVCDSVKASTGKIWYYIKCDNKYGFVSADYIARL